MAQPSAPQPPIDFTDFERVDIRVGTITDVRTFPEARRPAYRLWIDFGPELGIRKSSAQITEHYLTADLIGRQVAAVVNFPPKQIARFLSQVLVLGFPDDAGHVILVSPDKPVENGARLF